MQRQDDWIAEARQGEQDHTHKSNQHNRRPKDRSSLLWWCFRFLSSGVVVGDLTVSKTSWAVSVRQLTLSYR
jgi:hypothetical protein